MRLKIKSAYYAAAWDFFFSSAPRQTGEVTDAFYPFSASLTKKSRAKIRKKSHESESTTRLKNNPWGVKSPRIARRHTRPRLAKFPRGQSARVHTKWCARAAQLLESTPPPKQSAQSRGRPKGAWGHLPRQSVAARAAGASKTHGCEACASNMVLKNAVHHLFIGSSAGWCELVCTISLNRSGSGDGSRHYYYLQKSKPFTGDLVPQRSNVNLQPHGGGGCTVFNATNARSTRLTGGSPQYHI